MALLGQHKRIPDPTAADATAALGHKSGYCQSDSEIDREIFVEIHRRSVDMYMNQYLDCLQQVHEERAGHVYEVDDFDDGVPPTDLAARAPDSNATGVTREEWRLKISRDSLARDLLAVHETLEFLKTRAALLPSRGALPISALSISAAMIRNSHRWEAIGVVATDVAGVACYYSSDIWKWIRTASIERCQAKVEALLRRLNKGEVDERNGEDLRGMSFWMVDHFRK
ncbi:hypothetical protein QBC46DRAFT_362033 [Diplogelasinospora grovesii]|uniref:Uncharacterized protein n=1 Tax=Diplogelasinospora grovesii TaxID=303347 RepID=A0AAN6NG44_9PEZI|nr:hypothetical protein QBC46DRAFT_362033 [Diplogelasinospora grovesii]